MPKENTHRDLEWLKRVLRKHFKHAWPRIAARLQAKQAA